VRDDRSAGHRLAAVTATAPATWGLTYLVTTELLPPGRPLLAATLRALPAGLLLSVVGRQLPRGRWWGRALVLGTLNIGAFFALLFVAAQRLPGGVAATLGAAQPLLAMVLAVGLLGERLRATAVVTGLVGVAGVALLVLRADAGLDPVGVAAGLAATSCMALGVVLAKRWGRPASLLVTTSWQLVAGGVVLVPVALLVEGPPPALTLENLAGHVWLATVGTALAYATWFRGVERLPIRQVSILGLLSPLVATLAGWLVLGQRLAAWQLLGLGLVLGSVLAAQLLHERGERSAGRPAARLGLGHRAAVARP
jgi:probable blue pigment (indigoidine) exporter